MRPGKGGKYCLSKACSNVDRLGEKRAAWWKATKSAGWLELPMAIMAMKGWFPFSWRIRWAAKATARKVAGVWSWRGTLHKPSPVPGHKIGCSPGHLMVASSCSNRTLHPALVSGETPTRLCWSVSKVWALAAAGGRPGRGRVPIWVDVIVCWLATWTVIGVVAGCLLSTGVSSVTK